MTRKARQQDHGAQLADGERERGRRGRGMRKGGREEEREREPSGLLLPCVPPNGSTASPMHYYLSVQTQEPMGTPYSHTTEWKES